VNHLITNFHLPRSTLLMLVCAFVDMTGDECVCEAGEKGVTVLFYGDAMVII